MVLINKVFLRENMFNLQLKKVNLKGWEQLQIALSVVYLIVLFS